MKRELLQAWIIVFALALTVQTSHAQISVNPTDENYIIKKDQDRHNQWKEGKSQFPGKPRDMWQVGVGVGSFLISGDVKPAFGWGTSLHVRKSLGYVFSLKAEYLFSQASGLNYAASNLKAFPNIAPFTVTALDGTILSPGQYGPGDSYYANYKIEQHHALSLQTVYNLNNIKFHKKSNKWSLNLIIGLGANLYQTRLNALDDAASGNSYATQMNDLVSRTGVGQQYDITKLADRASVLDEIRAMLDDTYETLAPQNATNILTIGEGDDRFVVNPFVNTGLSLEFLISPRFSMSLEHQVFFSDDDFFDGKSRKENGSRTSNIDIPHYTSLRLNFHIGKKDKSIQPLWFVNPLIYPMQDIADLKEKLDDDWFTDSDNDGVVDALDEEPETPEGTEVDTKGRSLDSDGDGIANTLDKEPFSPPGYPVDETGVAQVPRPIHPEDVTVLPGDPETGKQPKLIIGDQTYDPMGGFGGMKDWYLPMIHFDLDKYDLRPDAYEQLLHVATVMNAYPRLNVVVHGHTDVRHSNAYNDMLSYNRSMTAIEYLVTRYGIDKSRFVLKYNGEVDNLVQDAKTETEHFMNRRVEFYIADKKDSPQDRPASDGGVNRKWKY